MSRRYGDEKPPLRAALRAANLHSGHWYVSLVGFLAVGGVMALVWGDVAVGAVFLSVAFLGAVVLVAVGRRLAWRGDLDTWDAERAASREAWRGMSGRQKAKTVAGMALVAALFVVFRLFLEYLKRI